MPRNIAEPMVVFIFIFYTLLLDILENTSLKCFYIQNIIQVNYVINRSKIKNYLFY